MPEVKRPRPGVTLSPRQAGAFYRRLKADGASDRAIELPWKGAGTVVHSVQLPATEKGNSVHIQFIRKGNRVAVFGHVEPDPAAAPIEHVVSAFTGDRVSWGLGR